MLMIFTKNIPGVREVPDFPDDEGELFAQLVTTLLPILLIGLLFVMMMRKVGGPGGLVAVPAVFLILVNQKHIV